MNSTTYKFELSGKLSSLLIKLLSYNVLFFFQAVKNEVNVPCLKNFVEKLYSQTLDMCTTVSYTHLTLPTICSV